MLLLGAVGAAMLPKPSVPPVPVVHTVGHVERAPLCPWRQPEEDMRRFFPGAARQRLEIRITSSVRPQLERRLGRAPTAEENLIYLYRVLGPAGSGKPLGTVTVRRVKGERGGAEVVVALSPDGTVRGVRLQRLREPEEVARQLESRAWLERFRRWPPENPPPVEGVLAGLPEAARPTARAIAAGVRDTLIVAEVAEKSGLVSREE